MQKKKIAHDFRYDPRIMSGDTGNTVIFFFVHCILPFTLVFCVYFLETLGPKLPGCHSYYTPRIVSGVTLLV